jgi:hypothetical protein
MLTLVDMGRVHRWCNVTVRGFWSKARYWLLARWKSRHGRRWAGSRCISYASTSMRRAIVNGLLDGRSPTGASDGSGGRCCLSGGCQSVQVACTTPGATYSCGGSNNVSSSSIAIRVPGDIFVARSILQRVCGWRSKGVLWRWWWCSSYRHLWSRRELVP